MGVFHFPAMEDYWHGASRFNLIANIMSRNRFKQLRRFIHFSDNQQFNDSPHQFCKIRPRFKMLRKQCLNIPSTYKQSVDEVMVAYKGTRAGNLRQYITNKPDKWGFKMFCRASSSGIIHDMLLYQGASTFFNVALSEQEQKLLLGAKVVTTLYKTIKLPRLSIVFCDNYFTSFNLIQNLHSGPGIKCIGTVRENRNGRAPLMTHKELVKKGRGAFDYRSSEEVVAVKWFDNKCVNLLSSLWGRACFDCQAKRPRQRFPSHAPQSFLPIMNIWAGLIFPTCWSTFTRPQPRQGHGTFPCSDTCLTYPLQIPGWSTRGTVAC
ncbi:hypothetical protein KUCAC02_016557 [Chaenocephalus aceratus]|nr:hypothetical protein KUCAC02_016557 [Chaenocephalus aceratus]